MKVLIIGKGKVGEATAMALRDTEVDYHDPPKGLVVKNFDDYCLTIICVDTLRSGPYDHTIVHSVISELEAAQYKGIVLIRSTVSPEMVLRWKTMFQLRIVMFPEFMRQTDDLKMDTPWAVVLGGDVVDTMFVRDFLVRTLYCTDLSKYHLMTPVEASIVKLCQNAGLATKVIFYNMVNELCERYNASYERVRHGVGADERVGIQYSIVPSPDDGKKGFQGHCLPKDVACLAEIETHGFFTNLLSINKALGR